MSGRTRWSAFVGAAVLVGAGAAYGWSRTAGSKGERAPDVAVQLLHGGMLTVADLRGQVVLVNFWATWCPPCRVEMGGFQRVYEARRDDGFTILGLSTDLIGDDQIRWFLEQRGIEYMVGRATRHASESFGGANTLPTSILIDARGRIRRTVVGVYEEAELLSDVDGLLREAGREPTGEVAVAPRAVPDWMELEDVGHAVGNAEAPTTVVEFSDYGCAYCSRFTQQTFPQLYAEFVQSGRVRWVHVPFVLGKFANSDRAAVAASCAAEQGEVAFWSVHMALFRRQPEWRDGDPLSAFRRYVEVSGGDGDSFTACYREDRARETLVRADRIAAAAGVAATPTFFIDGARLEGAAPLAEFRAALVSSLGD